MCNCINIEPQSKQCYAQQITVTIPEHMHEYRMTRMSAGLSGTISIDPCIFAEIWWLWSRGVITFGCCCGHNTGEPFVNVHDDNIQWMLNNGYVQPDPERRDTFRLNPDINY